MLYAVFAGLSLLVASALFNKKKKEKKNCQPISLNFCFLSEERNTFRWDVENILPEEQPHWMWQWRLMPEGKLRGQARHCAFSVPSVLSSTERRTLMSRSIPYYNSQISPRVGHVCFCCAKLRFVLFCALFLNYIFIISAEKVSFVPLCDLSRRSIHPEGRRRDFLSPREGVRNNVQPDSDRAERGGLRREDGGDQGKEIPFGVDRLSTFFSTSFSLYCVYDDMIGRQFQRFNSLPIMSLLNQFSTGYIVCTCVFMHVQLGTVKLTDWHDWSNMYGICAACFAHFPAIKVQSNLHQMHDISRSISLSQAVCVCVCVCVRACMRLRMHLFVGAFMYLFLLWSTAVFIFFMPL